MIGLGIFVFCIVTVVSAYLFLSKPTKTPTSGTSPKIPKPVEDFYKNHGRNGLIVVITTLFVFAFWYSQSPDSFRSFTGTSNFWFALLGLAGSGLLSGGKGAIQKNARDVGMTVGVAAFAMWLLPYAWKQVDKPSQSAQPEARPTTARAAAPALPKTDTLVLGEGWSKTIDIPRGTIIVSHSVNGLSYEIMTDASFTVPVYPDGCLIGKAGIPATTTAAFRNLGNGTNHIVVRFLHEKEGIALLVSRCNANRRQEAPKPPRQGGYKSPTPQQVGRVILRS